MKPRDLAFAQSGWLATSPWHIHARSGSLYMPVAIGQGVCSRMSSPSVTPSRILAIRQLRTMIALMIM